MAAIDDLKDQRQELSTQLDALQVRKAFLQKLRAEQQTKVDAQIAAVDLKIDALRARRSAVTLAIRDLTDGWTPV